MGFYSLRDTAKDIDKVINDLVTSIKDENNTEKTLKVLENENGERSLIPETSVGKNSEGIIYSDVEILGEMSDITGAVGAEIFNTYNGSNIGAGAYSHTQGISNKSLGYAVHTEGTGNTNIGSTGHVEGSDNFNAGSLSHLEGVSNWNTGERSHIEGTTNKIGLYDETEMPVQDYIDACSDNHVEGVGNMIFGSLNHVEGTNNYIASEINEETGEVLELSTLNHIEGAENNVSGTGNFIHAPGVEVDARYATVFGGFSQTTAGVGPNGGTVKAENSFYHGEHNVIGEDAYCAFVSGEGHEVSQAGSQTFGFGNINKSPGSSHYTGSMVSGLGNSNYAKGTSIEGAGNWCAGEFNHMEGTGNWITPIFVEEIGFENLKADLELNSYGRLFANHIEGTGNSIIAGDVSHIEGSGNKIVGDYENENIVHGAHVEGSGNTVTNKNGHAEGGGVTVNGMHGHAEGFATTALGDGSHAEGGNTTASGRYSHAEGESTIASGLRSHTSGNNTQALGEDQFVAGKYNLLDNQSAYAFIVGNGDNDARSNAFTLDWDGNLWVKGDVFIGNGSAEKVQNIAALAMKDEELEEAIDELKTKAHIHTNKGVLDGITEDDVIAWDDTVKEVNAARTSSTNSTLTLPSLSARVAYDLGNINSSSELRHSKQQMSIDALLLKEALIRGTVGMSYKKNLLPNTASTRTVNGVTFTVNEDGSVTANGTATARTHLHIGEVALNPDMYIFGDINETASEAGANMQLGFISSNYDYLNVQRLSSSEETYSGGGIHAWGNGNFEIERQVVIWISAVIAEGYTANNVIFYPMIRYADIEDDTYEPYTPSLQEQIKGTAQEVENARTNIETNAACIVENAALTASTLGTPLRKNLLPYPASVTKGGITFTFDSNGYMTASETSADSRQWTAAGSQYSVKLRAGTYILSFVSSTACTDAYGNIMVLDADSTKIADIGQKNYAKQQSGSVEFTLDTDQTVYVMAKIFDGTTGIMLRHADITDGTYEPYTKSIQEQLDELKAQIAAMTTAAATTETEE